MIEWLRCSGIREGERYEFVNGKVCGRKLLLFDLKYGYVEFEVKCPRCNAINEFEFNQNSGIVTHAGPPLIHGCPGIPVKQFEQYIGLLNKEQKFFTIISG